MSQQIVKTMTLVESGSSVVEISFESGPPDWQVEARLTPAEWAALGSPREVMVAISAPGPAVHYDATRGCTVCDAEPGELCLDGENKIRSTPHRHGGRVWAGGDWSQGVSDSRNPARRVVSAPTTGSPA